MRKTTFLFSAQLWILLALTLGVLPIALSSTEMWDGIVNVHALDNRDWQTLKETTLDSNWYLTYGGFLLAEKFQVVAGIPFWIFFKLWVVMSIVCIAIEVRCLAEKVFAVRQAASAWLPALVFSFPIWYVFFSSTAMLGHLTSVWLGLLGYRLFTSRKSLPVLLGAVLITASFQLPSNCAFILALEVGRWYVRDKKVDWSYAGSASILLLSVAVFVTTRVVWPPVGTYVGYNRLLNPIQISNWLTYAKYTAFFATWLLMLAPVTIMTWWFSRRRGTVSTGNTAAPHRERGKLLVLAFLMLSACSTYILVGVGSPLFTLNIADQSSLSAVLASSSTKLPLSVWYGGWGARHLMLMMIPLVILVVVMALRLTKHQSTGSSKPTAFVIACITTITFGLCISAPGHWSKLERLAMEQSFVNALMKIAPPPSGEIDFLMNRQAGYASLHYETNYLLFRAYGSTKWSSILVPDHPSVINWTVVQRNNLRNVDLVLQPTLARVNLMQQYDWAAQCQTIARIISPTLSFWNVVWETEHAKQRLPPTIIEPLSTTCTNSNRFWRGVGK